VHIESLAGVWIASYFFIEKGVSYSLAAIFTTAYYLSFTVGRLSGGFLSHKLSSKGLIAIGLTLMSLGALLMLVDVDLMGYYFFVVVLFGLGCAPVFPNMMFINSLHFEEAKLSKIISLQMGVGYIGFGLLTPLAGFIFEKIGIVYYPLFLILVIIVIIYLFQRFLKKTKTSLEY
jgi:MFS family permease